MQTLQNFIVESIGGNILPFEDYSLQMTCKFSAKYNTNIYEYSDDCTNKNFIIEGSFNRLMSQMQNKDFAIITAYRSTFTKAENIKRNRILRGILNDNKLGVHQLVGHWRENVSGGNYKDAQEKDLVDTVERSYFVAKPDNMSFEDFEEIILNCLTIDDESQDSAIIHQNGEGYFCLYNTGTTEKIADKITINKIGQAYSQYVKKMNIPFIFEGEERPGSNISRQQYKNHGFEVCIGIN